MARRMPRAPLPANRLAAKSSPWLIEVPRSRTSGAAATSDAKASASARPATMAHGTTIAWWKGPAHST